jgi:toxin-antitoxin system PIN domain toxin
LAYAVILGFVRIATNPRATARPLAPGTAFEQVDDWLAAPAAQLIHPGVLHLAICRELLEDVGTGGDLTTDAHLAALAIEQNATLASFDSDFHRFGNRLDFEFLR